MARPSNRTAAEKADTVVSVLRGEVTAVEAGHRLEVSEQTIHNWKAVFLRGGREALEGAARARPTDREAELEERVGELARSLDEAHAQLQVLTWRVGTFPPSPTSR